MNGLVTARYRGLQSLPAAYASLFATASAHDFFLSLPWFENFERNILGPNDHADVFGLELANNASEALGALVMHRTHAAKIGAPRRLQGLTNYYTSLFAPVLRQGTDDRTAGAFAEALWVERSGWDLLDLRPLDPSAQFFSSFAGAVRELGAFVQPYFCFGNWYLEVGGRSYAEYLAGLSSSLRKNIPYYTRRLQRNNQGRIEIVTGGERVEGAVRDYERVYGASWKIPEPYPNFIHGLVRMAALQGWLRLGLVYIDDEPAAAQIWLVHGGTASIYKIAYDDRFKKHSVGTVLTARLMEHVIDVDRVRIVDYLSGDDEYKKEWMSHRRERWGIAAFNPRSVRGAWQAVRNLGGRRAKAVLAALAGRRDAPRTPS